MSKNQILDKLESVESENKLLLSKLDALTNTRNTGYISRDFGGRAPGARIGENIMSSRPFSYAKMLGCVGRGGNVREDDAKIELEFSKRFTARQLEMGFKTTSNRSHLIPLDPALFAEGSFSNDELSEIKGLFQTPDFGQDEWARVNGRFGSKASPAAGSPAMSFIDQSNGGALIAPPSFGSPIELLRNKNAFMSAGVQVVPLGPTGSAIYPRQTAATQGAFSPENNAVTPTNAGTGQLELRAKKVLANVILPGELIRFGGAAAEAMIRNDLYTTVSLLLDKGLLDGPGSNNQPLGLATMGAASGNPYGMAIVVPTGANQLAPQDVYQFSALVEENNAEPNKWLMRPKMRAAFYQARFNAGGGANTGGFTFEFTRDTNGKPLAWLDGMDVISTVQVSNTRGNGSQTYIICFDANDYLLGLYGALEIKETDQGLNLQAADQVLVTAILFGDGAPRHPAAVAFCDSLNFVVGP